MNNKRAEGVTTGVGSARERIQKKESCSLHSPREERQSPDSVSDSLGGEEKKGKWKEKGGSFKPYFCKD